MAYPVPSVLTRGDDLQRSSVLSGHSLCERLSPRRCTVAWCYSAYPHGLQVMITPSAYMSCMCLGNAWACLGNTRASLHAVATKPSSISTAHGPWRAIGHVPAPEPTTEEGAIWSQRTCASAGTLLSSEVRFGAEERVAEPLGTWL
jgi:hypothetical protein